MSSTNTFSFILPNFLRLNNASGTNNYTFSNGLPMPQMAGYEGINNLADLIRLVGPQNIRMNYWLSGSGQVPSHDCDCTHTQVATLNVPGYSSSGVQIFSDKGQGGRPWNISPNDWKLVAQSVNALPTSLNMRAGSNGPGCGCANNSDLRTWGNIYMSIRADVTVELLRWCTAPGSDNIRNPLCQTHMGDIMHTRAAGSTAITSFLQNDFCRRRFPDGLLQNITNPAAGVDPADIDLCACNMPQSSYDALVASISKDANISIGSVRPPCLLSKCLNSNFKGTNIDQCPGATCINFANLEGNRITGNVSINQTVQGCATVRIGGSEGGGNGGSEGGTGGLPSDTTNQTPTASPWRYLIWIILGIVVIALVIYLIYLIVGRNNAKTLAAASLPQGSPFTPGKYTTI
jgi:hypothetical protein